MCYNVAYLQSRADKYAERYKDVPAPDYQLKIEGILDTYYFLSGFSHPKLPVVCHDRIDLFYWGLIPAWVKDEKQAKEFRSKTLNAVGETAFEKPSFRKSIRSKRCLLGVNGFYEWRDFNGVKYPYFLKVKNEDLFSLGCIYETWLNKATGELIDSFSIITTPANPLLEKIHNLKKRMPLIIDRADEKKWIDPELPEDEVKKIIKPFDEKKMTAYTVSNMVNSARNERNVEEAMEEVEYQKLSAL